MLRVPLSFADCLVSQIGDAIEIILATQLAEMALIDTELNFGRNHNDVAVGGGQCGGSNADLAGGNGPGLASAIVSYPREVYSQDSFLVFYTTSLFRLNLFR
jgi:hypothetical protein